MENCNCDLGKASRELGFSNFPLSTISDEDPLLKRFENEKWSFQNPILKQSEEMSVIEIIKTQSHLNNYDPQENAFKMYPPVKLHTKKQIHGFPKHLIEDEGVVPNDRGAKSTKQEPIKDKKSFKEKWLGSFRAYNAEDVIAESITSVFSDLNVSGFAVPSYESGTYLQPLIEKAKAQRNNEKQRGTIAKPSELETNIALSLGIEIIQCENLLLELFDIPGSLESTKSSPEWNQLESITMFKKSILEREFKSAKQNEKLKVSSKINSVLKKFYEESILANRFETDLLLVLEKEKLVIFVETKSTEDKPLWNTIKHAADQLKIRKKVLYNIHKDILDSSWQILKILAFPYLEDKLVKLNAENISKSTICDHCRQFILDQDDIIHMKSWIDTNIKLMKNSAPILDYPNPSYTKLYNRIIGFMSLSSKFGISSNLFLSTSRARKLVEKEVLGSEKGVTSEMVFDEEFSVTHDIKEDMLKTQPLSSLQVMYFWNEQQLQLLLNDEKKVFFMSDFGVGKTLLMKHIAVKLSQKENQHPIYYISMASSKINMESFKIPKIYPKPSVFDVATSIDFEDTSVNFLSLADLMDHEDRKNMNQLGEIVSNFLEDKECCHIFLDEFPLLIETGASDKSLISKLINFASGGTFVWITFRLCEIPNENFEKFSSSQKYYEDTLQNAGFIRPNLVQNMRNSSHVVSTFQSIYGYGKDSHFRTDVSSDKKQVKMDEKLRPRKEKIRTTAPTTFLPSNTVSGFRSVVVGVDDTARPVNLLPDVIKKYFKSEESLVILLCVDNHLDIAETSLKETAQEYKVTKYKCSDASYAENELQGLKQYLMEPSGILLTEAEAFNGMQARNVVVVGGTSPNVRNFIMRGISFVIFIQKVKKMDRFVDQNTFLCYDESLLNKKLKNRKMPQGKEKVWLWHLPHGVNESDIKNHIERNVEQSKAVQIEVSKLFLEEEFVGYKLDIPSDYAHTMVRGGAKGKQKFWPLGWQARYLKPGFEKKYKEHDNNYHNLAPTIILLKMLQMPNIPEGIQTFVNAKGVDVVSIEMEPDKSKSETHVMYRLIVDKRYYRTVIDEEFWKELKGFSALITPYLKDSSSKP